jgi:hypothetical protein
MGPRAHRFAVSLTLVMVAASVAAVQNPAQDKPPAASGPTVTGCLRAVRTESVAPHPARTVYTLELTDDTSAQPPAAAIDKTQAQPRPRYVLSHDASVALSKHVGQRVQLTGELLQPPSTPPGVTDPAPRAKPLPGDAEGTFRVTAVKVLSPKCS